MHDHGEILELAAAAIDFELSSTERSQLDAALETCSLCRRQASAIRATATILRRPSDIGTPNRVRDVVVGAALRRGRRTPALQPVLVASFSIIAILAGTVFIAGNRGFGLITTPSPSDSVPIPTGVAQTSPSASPSVGVSSPIVKPTPTQTAPASSAPPGDAGLLGEGDVAAMVTDGRLVIRTKPGTGADSAIFKTRIHPGQRVLIIEGPVEASGYPWYRILLGDVEGWAAGSDLDGEAWLAPVRDGSIAFVREASDGSGEAIYTVDPDGRSAERLLFAAPNLSGYRQLTWSSDGRRLAFVATPADSLNGSAEIYTIDADGSNLVRLTMNEVDDDSPAWSPDGTRLAFRMDAIDLSTQGDSSVAVTAVDFPGVTVLGLGANPVWSPDGLLIAMTVPDGGVSRIWVQQADGGQRRQITEVSVASSPPAWSPDGQRLLFASSGLFIVEVATGSMTQLTADPGSTPAWSVSGAIAFATPGAPSPGVFVIASDGSGLRRLSPNLDLGFVPTWSPDGRRLLYGDDLARPMVSTVDSASGRLTEVGINDGTVRSPAWQPLLP